MVITNLGTWVGGYSIVFYAALIPVFNKMRSKWLYFTILSLLAFPLDIFPLLVQYIGQQYSYLSNSYIDVTWTLGLGSLLRPIANMLLLLIIAYDLLGKNERARNNFVDQSKYVINRHNLEIERAT